MVSYDTKRASDQNSASVRRIGKGSIIVALLLETKESAGKVRYN
jgi:hypothetical protein